ncbi:MAG: cytochrome c family protein [Alphaproteobacteria bacterium]|nr:cytochrome c family protein [Alphaproteobacteria bacterium]
MKFRLALAALATAATVVAGPAAFAADPDAGKKVFRQCRACHVVDKEQNRVGPHLVGIIGRTAGAVDGFKYSKAMKGAGEDGLAWTKENIAAYLKDPKGFVKGNRMAFRGLKKDADVENVIAYLEAAGS